MNNNYNIREVTGGFILHYFSAAFDAYVEEIHVTESKLLKRMRELLAGSTPVQKEFAAPVSCASEEFIEVPEV